MQGAVGQVASIEIAGDDLMTYVVAFSKATLNLSPDIGTDIREALVGTTQAFTVDDLIIVEAP